MAIPGPFYGGELAAELERAGSQRAEADLAARAYVAAVKILADGGVLLCMGRPTVARWEVVGDKVVVHHSTGDSYPHVEPEPSPARWTAMTAEQAVVEEARLNGLRTTAVVEFDAVNGVELTAAEAAEYGNPRRRCGRGVLAYWDGGQPFQTADNRRYKLAKDGSMLELHEFQLKRLGPAVKL